MINVKPLFFCQDVTIIEKRTIVVSPVGYKGITFLVKGCLNLEDMSDKEQPRVTTLSDYRDNMKRVLLHESRAYGFTLLIAGSLMFLTHKYGSPGAIDVFTFTLGALAVLFLLVIISFGNLREPIGIKLEGPEVPLGLVHLVSVLSGLGVAYITSLYIPRSIAFGVVSASGTLIYNLLLGLESFLFLPRKGERQEHPGGTVIPFIRKSLRRGK